MLKDVQYIEMVQDHVKWQGPELTVLNIHIILLKR
jgi:hypothetical protein